MTNWITTVRIGDVLYDIHSDAMEADPTTGMDEVIEPRAIYVHGTLYDVYEHLSDEVLGQIDDKLRHRDLYV